jgi:glycosyltransferase involved in cell wall biosynthesis
MPRGQEFAVDGADQMPGDGPHPRRVSVIVPAFDCRDTVGEQLAALGRQDYRRPWEVLLVDNGSTDGTRGVLARWASGRPHVRLLDALERRGAGYARNVGCRAATGDVLLFCDADDVIDDRWVTEMAAAARRAALFTGVDETVGWPRAEPPAIESRPRLAARTAHGSFLPFARGGNVGVQADVLESVGGWDEDLLRGQDVELTWRVQLAGHPLHVVPSAHVRYRRPDGRGLLRHQFEFGRQAPGLLRRFHAYGAPAPRLRDLATSLVAIAFRAPYLLLSAPRRRAWLLNASGVAGRMVGTLDGVRMSAREQAGRFRWTRAPQ